MAHLRTQYRIVPYREKRKDRRILNPPLLIAFDGVAYETTNWSLGGFLLDGCTGKRARDAPISGSLGWDGQIFPFVGRVTRHLATTGELAVAFDKIGDDALAFLDTRLRDYLKRTKT